MKALGKIIFIIALIVVILFLGQIIINQIFIDGLPASVILGGTSKSALEEKILNHYKTLVPDNAQTFLQKGEYQIESTYIDINNDQTKDLIVTLRSIATCGSGGCLATIFTKNQEKEFLPLENFSYAVKDIQPLESYTNNMRDLRINNDSSMKMIWDTNRYVIEQI